LGYASFGKTRKRYTPSYYLNVISLFIKLTIGFIAGGGVGHADIASSLKSFFKSAGVASNATSPGAYKDQAAGYSLYSVI
jgi:hypothetical protein